MTLKQIKSIFCQSSIIWYSLIQWVCLVILLFCNVLTCLGWWLLPDKILIFPLLNLFLFLVSIQCKIDSSIQVCYSWLAGITDASQMHTYRLKYRDLNVQSRVLKHDIYYNCSTLTIRTKTAFIRHDIILEIKIPPNTFLRYFCNT